ncbi:MAG: tail fiber domain-containing protein, partial [Akkermansiaceae bacterium]|nr:tail fiber domain-containing protein [Akkermansiaceae bacterium]
ADVVNGRFNVIIGGTATNGASLTTAMSANPTAYLEIQMSPNAAISPRQIILPAPRALSADVIPHVTPNGSGVDIAGNLGVSGSVTAAGFGNVNAGNVTATGTASVSGNLGVGTFPAARLHVYKAGLGFPATSGTTQSAGHLARFDDSSGQVLDLGGYSTNGYWLQVTNQASLTSKYPLLLNPNGGYVGIGTTSPGVALDVAGSGSVTMTETNHPLLGDKRGIDHGTTNGWRSNADYSLSTTSWNTAVSIRADKWIASAYGFVAYSDRRIKRDLQASATAHDLKAIQQLQVTDYRMVDPADGGNEWRKGFIAQEVEKVIPGAVSRSTEYVPDIFSVATALVFDPAAKTLSLTLTKEHGLKTGDRVRLHMDGKRVDLNVNAVPSARNFVVANCENAPEKVLVYGKQVNDFRTVDYDRIFTTAVGALQELKKEKDLQVATLQAENAALKTELAQQAAKDQDIEARLALLERSAPGATATVQISLKK